MVTISLGSVNVPVNSIMILTCEVQSLTTPNVTWTSDTDVPLPFTSLVGSNEGFYTSNITLEQVTLEYSGEYICTAKNLGGEMSDVINVDVFGKKFCVSIHLSVVFNVDLNILSTYYMINIGVHSPMIHGKAIIL